MYANERQKTKEYAQQISSIIADLKANSTIRVSELMRRHSWLITRFLRDNEVIICTVKRGLNRGTPPIYGELNVASKGTFDIEALAKKYYRYQLEYWRRNKGITHYKLIDRPEPTVSQDTPTTRPSKVDLEYVQRLVNNIVKAQANAEKAKEEAEQAEKEAKRKKLNAEIAIANEKTAIELGRKIFRRTEGSELFKVEGDRIVLIEFDTMKVTPKNVIDLTK